MQVDPMCRMRLAPSGAVIAPLPARQRPSAAQPVTVLELATASASGPLSPGPLTPPDPTIGAPAKVPPGPPPEDHWARDAAWAGAGAGAGAIAGGILGGAATGPLAPLGAEAGAQLGAFLGGLAGAGLAKLL